MKFMSKFYISPVWRFQMENFLQLSFSCYDIKVEGHDDNDQNEARRLNQLMCCRDPADSHGSHQSLQRTICYLILLTLIFFSIEMCFHVTLK